MDACGGKPGGQLDPAVAASELGQGGEQTSAFILCAAVFACFRT